MERYFEDIFEKYDEVESAIEECMYEIDLMDSFGVAMEDPTKVTTGSSPNTSSGSKPSGDTKVEGNPAASKVASMNASAERDSQDHNNDQTNREGKGEADSKTKTEIANKIKEIANQIAEFIRETIVAMKSDASDMLKENADTVAQVNNLIHRNKRNSEMHFKDFNYNDQFIGEFGASLDRAYTRYNDSVSRINGLINEYKQLIASGDDEGCKSIEEKLKDSYGKESNGEPQNDLPMEGKLISPVILVRGAMRFDGDKSGITDLKQLKDAIYNQYKGVTDNDRAPKVYKVAGNEGRVDAAIDYLRKYRDYMKDVNACMDKLKTAAEEYKKVCDDINAFPSYTPFSKTLLLGLVNAISSHISQFNALTKYCVVIIRERGIAAEELIKAVYSDTVITKKENAEQGTQTSREVDNIKQYVNDKRNKTKPRQFAQEYHTARQQQQDRLAQYDREDRLRELRRR